MAPSFFLQALKEAAEGSCRELQVFVQPKKIPGRKGENKMLLRHQISTTVVNMGTFLEREKKSKTQKYGPKSQRKLVKCLLRGNCGVSNPGQEHGGYERSLHCW